MDCTTDLKAAEVPGLRALMDIAQKLITEPPTRDLVLTGAISLNGLCPGKIKGSSCPWGLESSDLELIPAIVGWKLHWVPVVVRRRKAT